MHGRAQVEAIKLLVRLGCEATVQDNVASTPLHVAAGEGHLDAIAALVSLVIFQAWLVTVHGFDCQLVGQHVIWPHERTVACRVFQWLEI